MTSIINLPEIKEIIRKNSAEELIKIIEEGFVQYAQKKVIVPPVGYMRFDSPPGDLHIKYGYIKNDDYYVIKIASGFYDNPALGLNSSNGMMLLFSQKTGEVKSILIDEGYLTDIRTAIAGAVAAKYLAPSKVSCIGIVGTGMQARLQLQYLETVTSCRDVIVWGRSKDKLESFKKDASLKNFVIRITTDMTQLTSRCHLIVTTTPSKKPLIYVDDVLPGTHITAMGADADGKQELDPRIIAKADIVVADSIDQCVDHGDLGFAVREGLIDLSKIIGLGDVIANKGLQRGNDEQITIADLTGVAIQDIQITKYVYEASFAKRATEKS
ncbi:ornithine cyclodeaminase family protein [soil metagenome]